MLNFLCCASAHFVCKVSLRNVDELIMSASLNEACTGRTDGQRASVCRRRVCVDERIIESPVYRKSLQSISQLAMASSLDARIDAL